MANSVQYINQDVIYLSRQHYCPHCQSELKKVEVSKILDRRSEEAKNMPKMFSKTVISSRGIRFRNYNFAGNVKYVWKEFECDTCNCHFTIEEMKKIEGIVESEISEKSPEEAKKVKLKKLIFNKILPFALFIVIAIIYYFFNK